MGSMDQPPQGAKPLEYKGWVEQHPVLDKLRPHVPPHVQMHYFDAPLDDDHDADGADYQGPTKDNASHAVFGDEGNVWIGPAGSHHADMGGSVPGWRGNYMQDPNGRLHITDGKSNLSWYTHPPREWEEVADMADEAKSWKFEAALTTNWEPGHYGKGLWMNDGTLHTWRTHNRDDGMEEGDGSPYHVEYENENGLSEDDMQAAIWIDPKGNARVNARDYDKEPDWNHFSQILQQAHPETKLSLSPYQQDPNDSKWDFMRTATDWDDVVDSLSGGPSQKPVEAPQRDPEQLRREYTQAWDETRERPHRFKETEMVPVEELKKYREYHRDVDANQYTKDLRDHIKQNGVTGTVFLDYNQDTGGLHMSEGNHRLEIADQLGITHLPTTVYRSQRTPAEGSGGHSPKMIAPDQFGYVPQYIRPSQVGLPVEGLTAPSNLISKTVEGLDSNSHLGSGPSDELTAPTGPTSVTDASLHEPRPPRAVLGRHGDTTRLHAFESVPADLTGDQVAGGSIDGTHNPYDFSSPYASELADFLNGLDPAEKEPITPHHDTPDQMLPVRPGILARIRNKFFGNGLTQVNEVDWPVDDWQEGGWGFRRPLLYDSLANTVHVGPHGGFHNEFAESGVGADINNETMEGNTHLLYGSLDTDSDKLDWHSDLVNDNILDDHLEGEYKTNVYDNSRKVEQALVDSGHLGQMSPERATWEFTGSVNHNIQHLPGEYARGLVTPKGEVHTWPVQVNDQELEDGGEAYAAGDDLGGDRPWNKIHNEYMNELMYKDPSLRGDQGFNRLDKEYKPDDHPVNDWSFFYVNPGNDVAPWYGRTKLDFDNNPTEGRTGLDILPEHEQAIIDAGLNPPHDERQNWVFGHTSLPKVRWMGAYTGLQGDHSFWYNSDRNEIVIGSPELHHLSLGNSGHAGWVDGNKVVWDTGDFHGGSTTPQESQAVIQALNNEHPFPPPYDPGISGDVYDPSKPLVDEAADEAAKWKFVGHKIPKSDWEWMKEDWADKIGDQAGSPTRFPHQPQPFRTTSDQHKIVEAQDEPFHEWSQGWKWRRPVIHDHGSGVTYVGKPGHHHPNLYQEFEHQLGGDDRYDSDTTEGYVMADDESWAKHDIGNPAEFWEAKGHEGELDPLKQELVRRYVPSAQQDQKEQWNFTGAIDPNRYEGPRTPVHFIDGDYEPYESLMWEQGHEMNWGHRLPILKSFQGWVVGQPGEEHDSLQAHAEEQGHEFGDGWSHSRGTAMVGPEFYGDKIPHGRVHMMSGAPKPAVMDHLVDGLKEQYPEVPWHLHPDHKPSEFEFKGATNEPPYQLGNFGKGILHADGKLQTWNLPHEYGSPHHLDMLGDKPNPRAFLNIDADGKTYLLGGGSDPGIDVGEHWPAVKAQAPDLSLKRLGDHWTNEEFSDGDDWNFEG